jgi:hypothetical protein
MTEIPPIVWFLMGLWTSFCILMFVALIVKIRKSEPIRKRKKFKLVKGDKVG